MLTRRLDSNHDMCFGHGANDYTREAPATAQAVKQRLFLLRGEWFLDTTAGVPYLQQIAVRPEDIPLAQSIIKQQILDTEGVASISSFSLELDGNTRALMVNATVTTIYDETTTIRINLT